jgi:AcrR family transcriptional regulator
MVREALPRSLPGNVSTQCDDREKAVLVVAEQLLSERSLTDISIDDLARDAGASRATFTGLIR